MKDKLGEKAEGLLRKGDVTIESTSDWYFPGNVKPDPSRIIATFTPMVDLAV